jgi:hypothetical protein
MGTVWADPAPFGKTIGAETADANQFKAAVRLAEVVGRSPLFQRSVPITRATIDIKKGIPVSLRDAGNT